MKVTQWDITDNALILRGSGEATFSIRLSSIAWVRWLPAKPDEVALYVTGQTHAHTHTAEDGYAQTLAANLTDVLR